jgi:hypothetical protein
MKAPIDVLFTVGHDLYAGQSGAIGCGGIPERYFMGGWAPSFARACRVEGLRARVDTRREEVDGYTARQLDLCDRANDVSPRFVIDLHHNAGGYPGSLAICTEASDDLARLLTAAIARAQGTRDIGTRHNLGTDGVPRSWGDSIEIGGMWYPAGSELYILTKLGPDTLAMILEPFDGSDATDYAAGLAALRSGATQATVASTLAAHVARYSGG